VAPGKLVRAEAVSLAQCLGHLGVGMEPDVRFGGLWVPETARTACDRSFVRGR
jgi:hypothetical protein